MGTSLLLVLLFTFAFLDIPFSSINYEGIHRLENVFELFRIAGFYNIPFNSILLINPINQSLTNIFIFFIVLTFIKKTNLETNFKDFLFEPNIKNRHNKYVGFLYFFSVKYLFFLKLSSIASSSYYLLSSYSQPKDNFTNYPNWFLYVSLVINIFIAVILIYQLRKFLIEFFVSKIGKLSWLYLLCLLPIVGFFVWIYIIYKPEKDFDFKEIELSNLNSQNQIVYSIVGLLICSVIWNYVFGNQDYDAKTSDFGIFQTFSPILIALLFLPAVKSKEWYFVLLSSLIGITLGILYHDIFSRGNNSKTIFNNSVNSFLFYFMIYPLFHNNLYFESEEINQ
jgi:hypothetical protein